MTTRFTYPPVNLNAPIEPQLIHRAEWVGFKLVRIDSDGKGLRWKLTRTDTMQETETHIFRSLCEVDMKLEAVLEQIGDRVQREQLNRMRAARDARAQVSAEIARQEPTVN